MSEESQITTKPSTITWTGNDDPVLLKSYLNKHIQVDIKQKQFVSGFVHSIDPLTKSLIIKIPHNETFKTIFIPGCSIVRVTFTQPSSEIEPQPCVLSPNISEELCQKRKLEVKDWLQRNLLPIEEKDDKITLGEVSILPPYGVNDICCLNTTVSMDFRRLLMNMPKDPQNVI